MKRIIKENKKLKHPKKGLNVNLIDREKMEREGGRYVLDCQTNLLH